MIRNFTLLAGLLTAATTASGTIIYDWSPGGDQGLQGWSIVQEDTTTYIAINPYTLADRGDRLGPHHGQVLQNAAEVVSTADQDVPHVTLVAESPAFSIGNAIGDVNQIDFRLNQGSAGGPLVAQTGRFGAILVMLLAGGYAAFRHQRRRVA